MKPRANPHVVPHQQVDLHFENRASSALHSGLTLATRLCSPPSPSSLNPLLPVSPREQFLQRGTFSPSLSVLPPPDSHPHHLHILKIKRIHSRLTQTSNKPNTPEPYWELLEPYWKHWGLLLSLFKEIVWKLFLFHYWLNKKLLLLIFAWIEAWWSSYSQCFQGNIISYQLTSNISIYFIL